MPGAQDRWDQLAEPSVRSQEALTQLDPPRIADRPERGSLADLRQRLERLPVGHPSSPYNDDLSRKPPVVRLKDLELPLRDNERDTNGAAKHHEHDMAEGAPVIERAEAARHNGSGGRGRAADGLTPGDRSSTTDWSGTAAWSTAGRSSAADWHSITPRPSTSDRVSADGRLGADDEIRADDEVVTDDQMDADDRVSADEGIRADDGIAAVDRLGAGDRISAPRWSSTDHASTNDRLSSRGDAISDADRIGTAHWSSADDLSNTAEWSRAAEWSSARDWDGSTSDWDGSDRRDGAAKTAWLEPEPAIETDNHAVADTARRFGDDSWERNGRYLTPDECRVAEEALSRGRTAEGRNVFGSYGHSGLTPAMRRLDAQLEHGQLLPDTENYALKPPDLFKERLADLILRHPDKSAEELSHEVHDAIRYVYIFDAEHYADATLQVHSRLKGQGFELEVRRNCWRNPEYKGINTRWRDPAHDIVFEVQFHTASSWDARQRAHASYRQIMDPATPPAERGRLRAVRAEMSAAIPVPPRCTGIPDYRREVL